MVKKPIIEALFTFDIYHPVKKVLDQEGVSHYLLKSDIDMVLQSRAEILKDIQFAFYIGYSEEKIKKIMSTQNISDKDKKGGLKISPTEPKYSLGQVVLQEGVKQEILNVLALLKNMHKIYVDWGFEEIDPIPRSVVNLWGPPGTGKTMTVHAIAKELEKKILILNYADIESKYVGEAPKNLISAFDLAEKEDAVIFFDEADSFLGKRITNIDSGHDQAINSFRSQMLMKLEDFKGIVFFATNLHDNYDRAFESRILKHIEFKLPDAEGRKIILKSKLPPKAPYAPDVWTKKDGYNEELLTNIAKIIEGFSGREIKNSVLELLVQASQTSPPLITADIMKKVFTAKKAEADSFNSKDKERKVKLSNQIQHNIKTGNYKRKKITKRR